MTGIPCASEALHCAVVPATIEERARAIMRHGRVTKLTDRSAAQFRAELPDGAIYTVDIPLRQYAIWRQAAPYESDADIHVRTLVLIRLVEQLTAEGAQ